MRPMARSIDLAAALETARSKMPGSAMPTASPRPMNTGTVSRDQRRRRGEDLREHEQHQSAFGKPGLELLGGEGRGPGRGPGTGSRWSWRMEFAVNGLPDTS